MNDTEAKTRAIAVIEDLVVADGPEEPRVVHRGGEARWYPDLLCTLSEHELSVLARGADVVVFLDNDGHVTGWRDGGRRGTRMAALIDAEALRQAVIAELGLPATTRVGRIRPAELPPVGWTHEAVLFLATVPRPDQVLRVWVSPETLRVIQCLYGPPPSLEERP